MKNASKPKEPASAAFLSHREDSLRSGTVDSAQHMSIRLFDRNLSKELELQGTENVPHKISIGEVTSPTLPPSPNKIVSRFDKQNRGIAARSRRTMK